MTGKLSRKVALVTGGTSGIGEATVKVFASEGAQVVLTGRRADRGEKVAEEERQFGVHAEYVQADLKVPLRRTLPACSREW